MRRHARRTWSQPRPRDTGACVPTLCWSINASEMVASGRVEVERRQNLAIWYIPDRAVDIIRLEVMTGQCTLPTRTSILDMSHGLRPELGGVDWTTTSAHAWQGRDFPNPIPVAAGAEVGLNWRSDFGCQWPVAQAGVGILVERNAIGTGIWDGQFGLTWMARLYCCE